MAVPRSKSVPANFTLILSRNGVSHRHCRVTWRTDAHLGIQFVESCDEKSDSDAAQCPARAPVTIYQPLGQSHATPAVDRPSHVIPVQIGSAKEAERRPFAHSTFAGMLTVTLAVATAVFYFAGSNTDMSWATDVCDGSRNFCKHPEMTGVAAVLMGLVFMAAKGMERD